MEEGRYVLDFPSRPATEWAPSRELFEALGARPSLFFAPRDYLCVFNMEEEVRRCVPDMRMIAGLDRFAVIRK
jgi:hypothetical protein